MALIYQKNYILNDDNQTHQIFHDVYMKNIVRAEVQCHDYLLHQRQPFETDEYTPFDVMETYVDVNLLYEKEVEFASGRYAVNSLFSDSPALESSDSWHPTRFFRQRLWR